MYALVPDVILFYLQLSSRLGLTLVLWVVGLRAEDLDVPLRLAGVLIGLPDDPCGISRMLSMPRVRLSMDHVLTLLETAELKVGCLPKPI